MRYMKIFDDVVQARIFTLVKNGRLDATRNGRFFVYFN